MTNAQRPKVIEEAVENTEKEVKEAVEDAKEKVEEQMEPEPKETLWEKRKRLYEESRSK